jgi:flagellar biosynthetic protein FliR
VNAAVTDTAIESLVLGLAMIFARIGGVFMIAPGLSSLRVPVRVRLFLALSISLALAPLLAPQAAEAVEGNDPAQVLRMLGSETIIGVLIGLLARLLLMALQTMAMAVANSVGLGGIPSVGAAGPEPTPAAADLFVMTAIVLIFVADLHYEILRAVVGSYEVVGPGEGVDARAALVAVTDRIAEAFFVGLRLAAPFFLYAVVVNFAVGIVNKLTPQIPAFFVALPFITAGGLLVTAFAIREMMIAFLDAFARLTGAL